MNLNKEEWIKQGRTAIIEEAIKQLKMPIDTCYYNVYVMTNETQLWVSFHMPIKIVPQNTIAYYNLGIDLINRNQSKEIRANPSNFNYEDYKVPLFIPTAETEAQIDFILDAINKSDEIGNLNRGELGWKDDMLIIEEADHFDITLVSYLYESFYKIEKETGRIYDAGHAHGEPPPFEEPVKWEEVKD